MWRELIVLSRSRKEWNLVSSIHIYPQCTISYGLDSTQKAIQPPSQTHPPYAHKLAFSLCKEALQHFKGTLPPNITKQHDTAWLQQKCWCRRKLCSLCIWLPLGMNAGEEQDWDWDTDVTDGDTKEKKCCEGEMRVRKRSDSEKPKKSKGNGQI